MSKPISNKILFQSVRSLIQEAQQHVVRNVNTTMLITYFEIGRIIIEREQKGKFRAGYAEETLIQLSKDLTKEFGKGYSRSNLEYMRSFLHNFPKANSPISDWEISKGQKIPISDWEISISFLIELDTLYTTTENRK